MRNTSNVPVPNANQIFSYLCIFIFAYPLCFICESYRIKYSIKTPTQDTIRKPPRSITEARVPESSSSSSSCCCFILSSCFAMYVTPFKYCLQNIIHSLERSEEHTSINMIHTSSVLSNGDRKSVV